MESKQVDQARKEITEVINSYFDIGRTKDLSGLSKFFAPSQYFTKFDDSPPYTRQNSDNAFVYEQAKFANISDFEFKIEELRIDVLGFIGIATFYLTYKGMFVNDYSFEGKPVGNKSRLTMVFGKFGEKWRIVHHHASTLSDG